VGVILYEFLFGVPPFNAATPQQVFENILMRRIDWFENEIQISLDSRDLMEKLMCSEIDLRIGNKGASEVKNHSWFAETPWDNLMEQKVYFIPSVKNVEDTDYFDSRGMQDKPSNLSDSDENIPAGQSAVKKDDLQPKSPEHADFGEAVYKNLPLLEKANQQTMSRITQEFPETENWLQRRRDSLPVASPLNPASNSSVYSKSNPRSISANLWLQKRRESLPANSLSLHPFSNPMSIPTSKLSSSKSSSSSLPHTASSSFGNLTEGGKSFDQSMIPARQSSQNFVPLNLQRSAQHLEEFDYRHRHSDVGARGYGSSPERDSSFKKSSQAYLDNAKQSIFGSKSKEFLNQSDDLDLELSAFSFFDRPIDVLIAESNPVGSKILETILRNLNCRCIRVKNGAEAVQCLMGEVKFDVIFADINISICINF
jgi:serine/threonine-protein kinase RIM15